MNPHVWLGFAAASLVMGLIPGPGVLSIVGYAIGSGRRTALASVAGLALGNLVAMTLSLAGVGALLAASALAFSILKWAGALYLVGLGLATILRKGTPPEADGNPGPPISPRAAFASNVGVGTFHPKTIVFFVAFVPQFIGAGGDYALQAAILIATFSIVVGCTDTIYALVAARVRHLLNTPGAALWSKRAGGTVLIAAGLATAAARN
jgi:threonine/homoserine/homoserine lactone efflux protein